MAVSKNRIAIVAKLLTAMNNMEPDEPVKEFAIKDSYRDYDELLPKEYIEYKPNNSNLNQRKKRKLKRQNPHSKKW